VQAASAYALGQDTAIGSLERGKLADLIVLSDDPLAVAPDELKDIVVRATTVGGKNRFCAPDSAWLCRDSRLALACRSGTPPPAPSLASRNGRHRPSVLPRGLPCDDASISSRGSGST